MRLRIRFLAITLFAVTATASAVSLHHVESIPALVLIAPGYVVQAWLFVRQRALGGLGCDLTMVGVSALVWTVLIGSGVVIGERLLRWFRRAA